MQNHDLFTVHAGAAESVQLKRVDVEPLNFVTGQSGYEVLIDNIPRRITQVKVDLGKKEVGFRMDGIPFTCQIEDASDLLIKALGMDQNVAARVDAIHAPMPGLVLEVLVVPEDVVHAGQPLLILQAMKMENVIKAPVDLIIKEVFISRGEKVNKDAVLLSCNSEES